VRQGRLHGARAPLGEDDHGASEPRETGGCERRGWHRPAGAGAPQHARSVGAFLRRGGG
jgi:hypothetical protein